MYLEATLFEPEKVCGCNPGDDAYRRFNYDLCKAIDLTSLSIVLNEMVEAGKMHPNMAKLYKSQAMGLLQLLRSENNRNHGY